MKSEFFTGVLPANYLAKTKVIKNEGVAIFFHGIKLLRKTDELVKVVAVFKRGKQTITAWKKLEWDSFF